MELIETVVAEFNTKQRELKSIKATFISARQHPWKGCSKEFKDHLDNLAKLPLYGGCIKDVRAKDTTKVENRLSLQKLAAREPAVFDVEGFVEQDEEEAEVLEILVKK